MRRPSEMTYWDFISRGGWSESQLTTGSPSSHLHPPPSTDVTGPLTVTSKTHVDTHTWLRYFRSPWGQRTLHSSLYSCTVLYCTVLYCTPLSTYLMIIQTCHLEPSQAKARCEMWPLSLNTCWTRWNKDTKNIYWFSDINWYKSTQQKELLKVHN